MKRLLLLSSVLMAVLLLPGLASATHILQVVAIGDCDGFNAQVDVHFRDSAEYLDLHYEVAVLDADSNEVVMVMGDMHVMNDGDPDISIMISDMFNSLPDGMYVISGMITITSPFPGGMDEDSAGFQTDEFECGSVANDEASFDNVKAMYR